MAEIIVASVAALAALVAAAAAVIGVVWKIPQSIGESEKRLKDEIQSGDNRLADKFDELNRSMGRVEGRLGVGGQAESR